jgi:hypothetical protein
MIAIMDQIGGVFKTVADKWIPDAKDRLEAEQFFFKQAHDINLGQIEINKLEAANDRLFVSGWRPFVGWACAGSLAYSVVVRDLLNWVFALAALYLSKPIPVLPNPDTTLMFELLLALLGFGGLRSWEKHKGLTK